MRRSLGIAAALAAFGGAAEAGERLRCTPWLPVFCENLHVSCSGRTKVKTEAFSVSWSGNFARLSFDGGAVWEGRAEGEEPVLRPAEGRDWVKVRRGGGPFSHRMHRRGKALMSIGTCEAEAGS